MPDIRWGRLIPLQRCSRSIRLPEPTGLKWFSVICMTLIVGVLLLCRDAVDVFYTSVWLGHSLRVKESYSSAEMQSMYSTSPVDWATRWGWESLTLLQRCSQCILQSRPTGPLFEGKRVLLLCRDAIGVFYSSGRLGHVRNGISNLISNVIFVSLCALSIRKERIHQSSHPNYEKMHIYQPLRSGRIWHKVNF